VLLSGMIIKVINGAACLSFVPFPGRIVVMVTFAFLVAENSIAGKIFFAVGIPGQSYLGRKDILGGYKKDKD